MLSCYHLHALMPRNINLYESTGHPRGMPLLASDNGDSRQSSTFAQRDFFLRFRVFFAVGYHASLPPWPALWL